MVLFYILAGAYLLGLVAELIYWAYEDRQHFRKIKKQTAGDVAAADTLNARRKG